MGFSYEPIFAKIEITRRCNLDCEMCYRHALGSIPNDMTLKQFKQIIDKTNFKRIATHGYGEPLIHPDFLEMMQYCQKKGVKTMLVTNGTLFTEELALGYLKTNPVSITFSIDSPHKEQYEKIRRGASFDRVMKNLKFIADNRGNTKVRVHMTVWKENYKTVPEMKRLCKNMDIELGIADITYSYDFKKSREKNSVRNEMPKNEYRKCYLPWLSTYIDVEGDVYPCTDNLNWKLGSIYEKSMKEIYNSEKMRKFRELSVTGKNENCVKCSAWAPGDCPIVKRYLKKKMGLGR